MNDVAPPYPLLAPEQAVAEAGWLFSTCGSSHPILSVLFRLATQRLSAGLQPAPGPPPPTVLLTLPGETAAAEMAVQAAQNFLESPKRRIKLPAPSPALDRLQAVMANPASSVRDMADIITMDPRLAASLLRVVNSPLYSLPAPVETVTRAVAILGMRQVSMLALAAAMSGMFQDMAPDLLDPVRFWRHSLACAVLSHGLALAAGREEPERHYLAGLLHDMGRLALHAMAPNLAKQARELHRAHGQPEVEAERRVFEFDHGVLGAMIFTSWRLPHGVVAAAASHHEPQPGGSETARFVHLANVVAIALGYAADPGEMVPPLAYWTWEGLGLPVAKVEELAGGLDGMVDALTGTC